MVLIQEWYKFQKGLTSGGLKFQGIPGWSQFRGVVLIQRWSEEGFPLHVINLEQGERKQIPQSTFPVTISAPHSAPQASSLGLKRSKAGVITLIMAGVITLYCLVSCFFRVFQ